MKCDVCMIGERQSQLIRYHVEVDGKLMVVERVPAMVCDRCGETSVAPLVASSVQRIVWGAGTPARSIETPVYDFAG